MNFAEYAPLARRTLKELPYFDHMEHMSLGFCGESGELLDAIKKHKIYGKPFDRANALEELGDISWYVVNLAKEFNRDPGSMDSYLDMVMREKLANGSPVQDLMAANLAFAEVGGFLCTLKTELDAGQTDLIMNRLIVNLGRIAQSLGLDLNDAFKVNIEKLAKRYGDKYTDYAALNRDLDAERTVLESAQSLQGGEA